MRNDGKYCDTMEETRRYDLLFSSASRSLARHNSIANNHLLLLANGSGIPALACTTVNVWASVAHLSKTDTIN